MPTYPSFDGVEIFYDSIGTGPAVLLIHGATSDSQMNWVARGIPQALEASGRRAITMDCRGHGRSAKPHDPAAYVGDSMALDASGLLDHLGVDSVDVVAYSMGSRIAARLAVLDGRVRSLVLGGCGDGDAGGATAAWFVDLLEVDDPAVLDAPGRDLWAFIDSRGCDRMALAAMARAHIDGVDRIEVDDITVPTLFLTGVDDHMPGEVGPLLERLPGARWVRVPGDHYTAPDDPAFLGAIVGFLGEVAAAQTT